MSDKSTLDRRDFLKLSATGAAVISAGLPHAALAQDGNFEPAKQPGRVVRVVHSGAVENPDRVNSDPVPEIVEMMVDTGILAFTGRGDIGEAWAEFIHPSDNVMIKINTLGSPNMATNKPVVRAIIRGLQAMGLPNENMFVYDQYRSRMLRARFRPGRDVLGVSIEFNETRGYSETATEHGAGESRFAVAVEECTAIINVPVIKDHDVCGVTMSMKNMTHGVIHNPSRMHRRNAAHTDTNCTVHAAIWNTPHIGPKVRLIVADGLRVMYHGGPQDNEHKVLHNSIYVGTDPVALDTVGKDAVAAARADHRMRSLEDDDRTCFWLAAAEAAGIGIADRSRITLEEHVLG